MRPMPQRSAKPPPDPMLSSCIGQDRTAAGHPGLACGSTAVGQAADDAAERHAWPGHGIRRHRSKRHEGLDELMTLVDEDKNIPKQAKQAITGLHDYCNDLEEGILKPSKPRSLRMRAPMRPPAVWRRSPVSAQHRVADRGNGWRHQSIQDGAAACRLARPATAELHRRQDAPGRTAPRRATGRSGLLVLGATSMVGRADGWNSATGAWLRTF